MNIYLKKKQTVTVWKPISKSKNAKINLPISVLSHQHAYALLLQRCVWCVRVYVNVDVFNVEMVPAVVEHILNLIL